MIDYENMPKFALVEKCKAQRFILIKLNKEIEELKMEIMYLKKELNKVKEPNK